MSRSWFISLPVGLLILLFSGIAGGSLRAGPVEPDSRVTRILFVFDASESMAELWQSDTKYRIAVKVLSEILDSLQGQEGLETGLRVYGPKRAPGPDCEDSYIMVPFGADNGLRIKAVLRGLTPQGTTPIAYSLEQTVADFTPGDGFRNVVILITDGLEACGGDPCRVSTMLQKRGIFLRPFIVGIGENMKSQFDCMGNYYNAAYEADYQRALKTIVATSLKEASAQVYLLDRSGNPTQTDVHITLYNNMTGSARYNFIHTLNRAGLPDTMKLDPLVTYDVVVQTIPPLTRESVWIEPGKHTVISLDARQGYLSFIGGDDQVFPCIIRQAGTGEAIHVQPSNLREKYQAGSYDITVLTKPRMNFNDVEISADALTQLTIPAAGSVTVFQPEPVVGSIYMQLTEDSGLPLDILWVEHLKPDQTETRLSLQPGRYVISYRPAASKRQADTKEKRFLVESGKELSVEL